MSHIDVRTQCIIMTQKNKSPAPYYMRHFQIFDKINSSLKNVSNVLDSKKKVDCIFEEPLNLHIIIGYLFSLPMWIPNENRGKLWTVMIFRTEDNFCCISDCTGSLNLKLKMLINEQIIIFYSPSNAYCSSDKSVQIKHFKYNIFICICSFFSWFNLQIMNFC